MNFYVFKEYFRDYIKDFNAGEKREKVKKRRIVNEDFKISFIVLLE